PSSAGVPALRAGPPASSRRPATCSSSSPLAKPRPSPQQETSVMAQKTHPIGLRLGIVKTWNSKWFEDQRYRQWLHEHLKLRHFLKRDLINASISEITIERAANKVKINIFSARPGIVIGKRGAGVEGLKKKVQKMTDSEVFLNIQEVRKAEVNAQLVAENI